VLAKFIGNQIQVLKVTLCPGEMIWSEPSVMVHVSNYIKIVTKPVGQGFQQTLMGQSFNLMEFIYQGLLGMAVAMAHTANFPGQMLSISLVAICDLSKGQFAVQLTYHHRGRLGEGFFLQGLQGSSLAF
jgi:uncharacterized protein (AIM24 family)